MGRKTQYLIVGQGIAGTMLAFSLILRKRGTLKDFLIADAGLQHSSSLISTGILNPIVFKRMTLSWGSDLLELAHKRYAEIETFLNPYLDSSKNRVLHKYPLIHLFQNTKDLQSWQSASPEVLQHTQYISLDTPKQENFGGILIKDSAWIDAGELLTAFRRYLKAKNQIIERPITRKLLTTGEIQFDRLILCTGIQFRYFSDYDLPDFQLPYYPVKGDVITMHIREDNLPRISAKSIPLVQRHSKESQNTACLKKVMYGRQVVIQALQQGLYRVGSSYVRDFSRAEPSQEGREWILSELVAMGLGKRAELEQNIIHQSAGIRPSTRDRIAYLGPLCQKNASSHSFEQKKVLSKTIMQNTLVFNGLGTRGFMLAPGLSEILCDWLLDGKNLPLGTLSTRI